MRLRLHLVASLLLVGMGLAAVAQPPVSAASPYGISGMVINSSTGTPVPRCRINAFTAADSRTRGRPAGIPPDGVETDSHGHFALSLPSAGRWSLRAMAAGFRPQAFEEHESFSSAIVLTETLPRMDVVFRIAPDGIISGTILDEGNEPVRQAQIQVFAVSREGGGASQRTVSRGFASTDDRGRYEVGGLGPGDYQVTVQARPWYATATQGMRSANGVIPLEPSLDVVYPMTWFPGVYDAHSAQILSLHDGESRSADVQLQPMPAFHLRIPIPPAGSENADGRRGPRYPQITSVSQNNFVYLSTSTDAQGGLEVNGLAPGVYRIQSPDENGQAGRSTIVEIKPDSSRNLDLTAVANTATVDVAVYGGPGTESLPLVFVDADDDRRSFRLEPLRSADDVQRRSPNSSRQLNTPRGGVADQKASARPDTDGQASRVLALPPGRYSVFQGGSADFYITGVSQGTTHSFGRLVTFSAGSSALIVHIGRGRASVAGTVHLDGKPVVGAMVLLVPTTVNQPGSITAIRRDQTNTDGSYDLGMVIPGQYILVAIDRGWDLKWGEPNILNPYLLKGVPLELNSSSASTQDLEVQTR